MKKRVITVLAIASLTTAAVGTSFGAADRMRGRGVELEELAANTPVSIRIEQGPEQGLFPLLVVVVLAGAVAFVVEEEMSYGCLTGTTPWELGDTVFGIDRPLRKSRDGRRRAGCTRPGA